MFKKVHHAVLFVVAALPVLWVPVTNVQATDTGAGEVHRILHPTQESGSSIFIEYYWRLLEEACRLTVDEFGPYEVVNTGDKMNHLRAMEELSAGNISVYIRAYIAEKFRDTLDLVPVPLDKGLLGHRIALIHKDKQDSLREIKTLEDLKSVRIGQGSTWLDSDILESAGMNVVRSTSYQGLFPMLANQRIDLFTRGANEVLGEYLAQKAVEPDLAIEDSLLLAYPMSFYFLVRKDDEGQRLKERLTLGLQKMQENGSFDRHYEELKKVALKGVDLTGRQYIKIPNNFYDLPGYVLDEEKYWDDLSAERGM